MDFTYFIAGFIAILVGLVAGFAFIAIRGKSKLRLVAGTSLAAFLLDWLLLIDWTNLGAASGSVLIFDFLFFAIYSIVGSSVGVAPALFLRLLWRERPGRVEGPTRD